MTGTMASDERIWADARRRADWRHLHAGDVERLPAHMRKSVVAYVLFGHPVGQFLTAVLSNDLMIAFQRADEHNAAAMREWIRFLYNAAPFDSFGSPDRVQQWIKRGGLCGDPPKE